jgi:hypothetical protein
MVRVGEGYHCWGLRSKLRGDARSDGSGRVVVLNSDMLMMGGTERKEREESK